MEREAAIPDFLKNPAALLTLCLALGAGGFLLGHSLAASRGEAVLAALKARYAEERRSDADAHGKALAESLSRYRAEVGRADALTAALSASIEKNKKDTNKLRKRISHAASNNTHAFSADFVRLYNDAIGAIPESPLPPALCAPGPAGKVGNRTAPSARLLCADAVTRVSGVLAKATDPASLSRGAGTITEADLLAHIVYYGARCRELEMRQNAWSDLAKGWK